MRNAIRAIDAGELGIIQPADYQGTKDDSDDGICPASKDGGSRVLLNGCWWKPKGKPRNRSSAPNSIVARLPFLFSAVGCECQSPDLLARSLLSVAQRTGPRFPWWPFEGGSSLVPVAGLESIQLISRIFVNTRFTRMDIAQSASRDFGVILCCAQIRARNDLFGSPKWPQSFPG